MVDDIKAKAKTWVPMEVDENPLSKIPAEHIKYLFGTYEDDGYYGFDIVSQTVNPDYKAPSSFDSRTNWPGKIHNIRDQGRCGSCWAFGATEAVSDRFNIQLDMDVVLSPQELVSCDGGNYGCNGGFLNKAFDFLAKHGVVADKDYPYTSGTSGRTGSCKHPTDTRYGCKSGSV